MTTKSGSLRNKRGAATESALEEHHRVAAMLNLAYVVKRPTSWKPLRPVPGGMLCVPEKQSGVDYVGVLADGRALFIEAKRHTGSSFPLDRIEPQQKEEMERVRRVSSGAVRLLVIEWFPTSQRDLQTLSLVQGLSVIVPVSWAFIERASATLGCKSIPASILMEYAAPKTAKTYLQCWKE